MKYDNNDNIEYDDNDVDEILVDYSIKREMEISHEKDEIHYR